MRIKRIRFQTRLVPVINSILVSVFLHQRNVEVRFDVVGELSKSFLRQVKELEHWHSVEPDIFWLDLVSALWKEPPVYLENELIHCDVLVDFEHLIVQDVLFEDLLRAYPLIERRMNTELIPTADPLDFLCQNVNSA